MSPYTTFDNNSGTKGGGSTADLAKCEHDGSTVEGVIDHVVGHQNP